jgi:CspA family cold shock protein
MPVRGRVKWFSSKKGYGFIETEGGRDVFAHYSEIVDSGDAFRFLESGMQVEFEVVEGERGLRASQIVKLKKPAPDTGESPPDVSKSLDHKSGELF